MKSLQNLFQVPISRNVTKGGLHYPKSCGDVTVSFINDEEIISLNYQGVELLPLFQQIEQATGDGLSYFYQAMENFIATRKERDAVDEENSAVENY